MPKDENELFEWMRGDPRFFLELSTQIRLDTGEVRAWTFNSIQAKQHNSIYTYVGPHVAVCTDPNTITLKTRQYGETTRDLGDCFWQFCFHPSVIKVITFRDETTKKLKHMVDLFYESSHEFLRSCGLESEEFLPVVPPNVHEMRCVATRALMEFTSEGSTGHGRSATVNRIYGTEYSLWEDPEEAMSGYAGSLAKTAARVHLDFTGQGIGNEAYREYQRAKRGESVYTARFYGRNDFKYDPVTKQGYTKEFLRTQKLRLRDKYVQEYPANDEEAFLVAADTRFSVKDIFKCGGYQEESGEFTEKYLIATTDFQDAPEALLEETFCHGVDPAEGIPTGSKTAIVTRHPRTGMLACEPYNDFLTPRETAFEIRRRFERMPGVIIVERNNHGHAVIEKIEDLMIRKGPFKGQALHKFLWKEPIPGKLRSEWKTGWWESKDNKALMETEYEERLAERTINMPDDTIRLQAREYCRRENGTTGRPTKGEKKGGKRVSYDDAVIADMVCIQGFEQALKLLARRRQTAPPPFIAGSMRGG